MAETTPRLGLYKKNPLTDGNDTFDIQTMLNDNWDKLDQASTPITLSTTEPHNPFPGAIWYEDLGEDFDLGGGGLMIGNASMEGDEKIWFDPLS